MLKALEADPTVFIGGDDRAIDRKGYIPKEKKIERKIHWKLLSFSPTNIQIKRPSASSAILQLSLSQTDKGCPQKTTTTNNQKKTNNNNNSELVLFQRLKLPYNLIYYNRKFRKGT